MNFDSLLSLVACTCVYIDTPMIGRSVRKTFRGNRFVELNHRLTGRTCIYVCNIYLYTHLHITKENTIFAMVERRSVFVQRFN